MEAGRGEPQSATARPAAPPRAGPEPAEAPDGGPGRRRARRRQGRRGGGATAAARSAPRAGLDSAGSRAAGRGRSEQLFSLAAAGGEGAGPLAPGQGDSFFCLKRRRSRPEQRGGAGSGAGAVRTPAPAPPEPRAGPCPEGPHLGRRATGFLRAGRGPASTSARPIGAGNRGWGGGAALPRSRGGGESRAAGPRASAQPLLHMGGWGGSDHPATPQGHWCPLRRPGARGGVPEKEPEGQSWKPAFLSVPPPLF